MEQKMANLKGKSFLTLRDFSKDEIFHLLDLATKLKDEKKNNIYSDRFKGKTIALIFEKRSTRTRCSFETAFGENGGFPVFLSTDDIQLGQKETVEDTARVLGSMFDAIQYRGFSQENVNKLAKFSNVPVYNGLTDEYHPTQILADILTIREHFGNENGIKLMYAGDGRNNVAISLMIGCAKVGINFYLATPKELNPPQEIVDECKIYAKKNNTEIKISDQIKDLAPNIDVIYTDVWVSMGEEKVAAEREKLLGRFQVNEKLFQLTNNEKAVFMHCLPAVREKEVTAEIIDGSRSIVWQQAENRKYTIKAVMAATLNGE
ncbi:MAG: ornithine carbamoyltransferase [Spirochaetales bacterium]|nr:ornithine carbamoyltransferase [Spirochaetales bacterium]